MIQRVPTDEVEGIVGSERDDEHHLARAVSADEMVYILHSRQCQDQHPYLEHCSYSLALAEGIYPGEWPLDETVLVTLCEGRLVPHRLT